MGISPGLSLKAVLLGERKESSFVLRNKLMAVFSFFFFFLPNLTIDKELDDLFFLFAPVDF